MRGMLAGMCHPFKGRASRVVRIPRSRIPAEASHRARSCAVTIENDLIAHRRRENTAGFGNEVHVCFGCVLFQLVVCERCRQFGLEVAIAFSIVEQYPIAGRGGESSGVDFTADRRAVGDADSVLDGAAHRLEVRDDAPVIRAAFAVGAVRVLLRHDDLKPDAGL